MCLQLMKDITISNCTVSQYSVFIVFCVPVKEQCVQDQERLRQECLHLQARLCAAQTECQKEREVAILHILILSSSQSCVFCAVRACVCVFAGEVAFA